MEGVGRPADMTDDATAFEPVGTRSVDASASLGRDGTEGHEAEWPSWLDSPWRVAGLWSVLAIGIVQAVYAISTALGVYGKAYQAPSIYPISLGGWIGGTLFTLSVGFILVRRQKELTTRDWVRYCLLLLTIVPGLWALALQVILMFPLTFLERASEASGWLAGSISLLVGFGLLLASVYGWCRHIGWRMLAVLTSGLMGMALFAAPFGTPDEHLFLDVVRSAVIFPVLIGFAAVRPLYRSGASGLRGVFREGIWYYGAALLFGIGTVYVFIGMSWLLRGSATMTL